MSRLCAISVDVDPLDCYYRIHGLGEVPMDDPVFVRFIPRFVELFERAQVPATFFLVGSSLGAPGAKRAVRQLAAACFELGNHTDTHPYNFGRLADAALDEEISRAHARIVGAAGEAHAPVGFRSPGYAVSDALLPVLARRGYRYDSSLFPSVPYYLAKAGIMIAQAATGRRSGSVLGDPRMLLASRNPYRPDPQAPWRAGTSPVIEIPIAVTPRLRWPVIGTTLALAPARLRKRLVHRVAQDPVVNLELHAIDLADAQEDALPEGLVRRQPDLRRRLADKRRALEETLVRLKETHEFVTLRGMAERLAPTL